MTPAQIIEECWQYQRELELLVQAKELTRKHESYLRHEALACQSAALAEIGRQHMSWGEGDITWVEEV